MTSPSEIKACPRCGISRTVNNLRGSHLCLDCAGTDKPTRVLDPQRAIPLARISVKRATELVCLVRDEGPSATGAFLDRFNAQQMYALAVTLAAMVPDDRPVDDLLAWTETLDRRLGSVVPEVSAA